MKTFRGDALTVELARLSALAAMENDLRASGMSVIAGIDEAGRGALAGPVTSAAVALPADFLPLGLSDSKKMTPKAREAVYDMIAARAIAWGVGMADEKRVDSENVLVATKRCMSAAYTALAASLGRSPDILLTDAVVVPGVDVAQRAIIKGDAKVLCIAAASVIAKVTRDRLMVGYDELYPGYGFAKHKGYGTESHYEALRKLGPSPIHRLTFLKALRF